jgi:protein-disulfide isomerase
MNLRGIVQALALAGVALLLGGAAGGRSNWDTVVAATDYGHRVGNPEAKVKLIEFFSYTCPHCAEFAQQGEAAIKLGYLAPGKVSVEYRHLIRDPVDLTVGMLVNCGALSKFPGNHEAFIMGQSRWIAPASSATAAQQQRWRTPGAVGRRAIATDFGFYAIMERRGYSRTAVDRCLADDATARRLAETSDHEWDRPGVDSTPTFAINGLVMPGTHTWASLQRQLNEFVQG